MLRKKADVQLEHCLWSALWQSGRCVNLCVGSWYCVVITRLDASELFTRDGILAFTDEVDHLINLFLFVVEVQRLHASLEIGRCEAFLPNSQPGGRPRVIFLYIP